MKPSSHHPLKGLLTPSGAARLRTGHPWLYRTHLDPGYGASATPGILKLGDDWFFLSPLSEIRLRRLGPFADNPGKAMPTGSYISSEAEFAQLFLAPLTQHFAQVAQRKRDLVGGENCFRWIFSESDGIPGLVADVFESEVVVQIQSATLERFWPTFRTALEQALPLSSGSKARIIELRNMPVRRKEGLEVIEVPRTPEGAEAPGRWIRWNGFEWWMNPGGPQKTGAYLDQKDNHLATLSWAKRLHYRNAWDLCCFEGGFGLHLAAAGLHVRALDQSSSALTIFQKNAQRNQVGAEQIDFREGNVFDELRISHQDKEKTDLIVLDPPSFVRSRNDKEGALRGLKELNLRSLHTLRPGGMLVTCTCSHHVSAADLEEVVREAAHDAHRRLKLLESRGPAPDHAPLQGFPESTYLQALYLEVQ
ncbi:MAG: class I SAM-dependent rRNA methyltransferase [Bdellovibrionales bacterium]|nr:class I SAM-dependent rRNA methyltransferase [Bdellovibrionales bacterium]